MLPFVIYFNIFGCFCCFGLFKGEFKGNLWRKIVFYYFSKNVTSPVFPILKLNYRRKMRFQRLKFHFQCSFFRTCDWSFTFNKLLVYLYHHHFKLSGKYSYLQFRNWNIKIQWNPINADTKGTCRSVRIIRVSVLSVLIWTPRGHAKVFVLSGCPY